MKFELHPEAAKSCNSKAEELIPKLAAKTSHSSSPSFLPDIHIEANIEDKDIIGEMKFFKRGRSGRTCEKSIAQGGHQIGLFDEGYQALEKVAESLLKNKALRDAISFDTLSDLLFDWVIARAKGQHNLSMTDWVLAECEKCVVEREIWIPISLFYIQSNFEIGKVTFKTITREMIDQWESEMKAAIKDADSDAQPKLLTRFHKFRKTMQGCAAATINFTAEEKRANEIAYEEADTAISLLRVYAPMNFSPVAVCYCAPLGQQHENTKTVLTVKEGKIADGVFSLSDINGRPWLLKNEDLAEYHQCGLGFLSHLAKTEEKTDFQERLFKSLLLYSKSSLAKKISDKLVYILVALESMLLRDSNEPIQDNIGSRMALLSNKPPEERVQIVKNVSSSMGPLHLIHTPRKTY